AERRRRQAALDQRRVFGLVGVLLVDEEAVLLELAGLLRRTEVVAVEVLLLRECVRDRLVAFAVRIAGLRLALLVRRRVVAAVARIVGCLRIVARRVVGAVVARVGVLGLWLVLVLVFFLRLVGLRLGCLRLGRLVALGIGAARRPRDREHRAHQRSRYRHTDSRPNRAIGAPAHVFGLWQLVHGVVSPYAG